MPDLVNQLGGPYFDFLVVEKDKLWERRGRIQRIVGIKPEFYHHPDALSLPFCGILVFEEAFQASHPGFSSYGYVIYETPQLDRLLHCLQEQIERISSCESEAAFGVLLPEIFTGSCEDRAIDWRFHWQQLQTEFVKCLQQIIEKVLTAQRESRELLVIGV